MPSSTCKSKQKIESQSPSYSAASYPDSLIFGLSDDDDFQSVFLPNQKRITHSIQNPSPVKQRSGSHESKSLKSSKKPRRSICSGKENLALPLFEPDVSLCDSTELDSPLRKAKLNTLDGLLEEGEETFYPGMQLDVLMRLCSDGVDDQERSNGPSGQNNVDDDNHLKTFEVACPLCGLDISNLSDEQRQVHTNNCLDKGDTQTVIIPDNDTKDESPQKLADVLPVLEWLRSLGLAKYEEVFTREEIDWDTLQGLKEEDLLGIGIAALGPRKKIMHALNELRKESITESASKIITVDVTSKVTSNKLITDYFTGSISDTRKGCTSSRGQHGRGKSNSESGQKRIRLKTFNRNGKLRITPSWCCIPGTPFRVDAFRYLRRDCSYWFLTHFHMDHYQGLTKSFCHGKIYCSSITARLVNTKLGIPLDKLQILPLNQKISIAGVNVTCFDANHCPGSIIIFFEPPNGKVVLHTGDFRFSEEMTRISVLQTVPIDTLILDTTYCNPQYDFPKQEAVIQFVIEAIQAEAFNPKTLFLIGSYTIGKERLFIEVAHVLRKKVYVNAAKLRILECLGLLEEDMQWFTSNENESHIHVVPMWTLASFKRLKHISSQYAVQPYSCFLPNRLVIWQREEEVSRQKMAAGYHHKV